MRKDQESIVRKVATKDYWREQDAALVVEAWKGSGCSQVEFCGRLGIEPGRLARWSRRLGATRAAVDFVPVRLVERSPVAAERPLELVVSAGRSVLIREGFSETTLRRLLLVLETSVC